MVRMPSTNVCLKKEMKKGADRHKTNRYFLQAGRSNFFRRAGSLEHSPQGKYPERAEGADQRRF